MGNSRMPKPNEALRAYFMDNEKFADLFNAYAFGGEEVIRAEELQPEDTAYADTVKKVKGVEKIGKYRDLVRKSALGATFVILALENQEKIHYAMPVRTMLYDVLGYVAECKSLGATQNPKEWTVDEFLSKLSKDTKLTPIVTLVLYTGEKEWDGPKSLYDMLEIDEQLRPYIPDYPINLIDMGHCVVENLRVKELEELFYTVKCIYDEKYEESNRVVSNSTLKMAAILTGSEELYDRPEEGSVLMCEALEKLMERGRTEGIELGKAEGIELGKAEGIELGKAEIIINGFQKGRTCEEIAEFMGLPLELVLEVEKNWKKYDIKIR